MEKSKKSEILDKSSEKPWRFLCLGCWGENTRKGRKIPHIVIAECDKCKKTMLVVEDK